MIIYMNILKKIGIIFILVGILLSVLSMFIPMPEIARLFVVSFLLGSGIVLIFISKLKMWKE